MYWNSTPLSFLPMITVPTFFYYRQPVMWFKNKKRSLTVQTPSRLGEKRKKISSKKITDKPFKWPSMIHCSFRRSQTAAKLRGASACGYSASPAKFVAPLPIRKPLPAVPFATVSHYPRTVRCGTSVISLIRASSVVPTVTFSSNGALKRPASNSYHPEPYRSGPGIKAARMTTAICESVYDSVYTGSEMGEYSEEDIYEEIIPTSSTPVRVNRKRCITRQAAQSPLVRLL